MFQKMFDCRGTQPDSETWQVSGTPHPENWVAFPELQDGQVKPFVCCGSQRGQNACN